MSRKRKTPPNPVSERMLRIILFKEFDVAAFASKIGKQRQNVSQMLYRDSYSYELFKEVTMIYEDVNPEWILTNDNGPFKCQHAEKVNANAEAIQSLLERLNFLNLKMEAMQAEIRLLSRGATNPGAPASFG